MTTTHEDIDSPALEVGDLWTMVNGLEHDINSMRREVYELDQAIADAFEERRKLLQAIEEQVGDIDWGY